jgi:hypothetical protein
MGASHTARNDAFASSSVSAITAFRALAGSRRTIRSPHQRAALSMGGMERPSALAVLRFTPAVPSPRPPP